MLIKKLKELGFWMTDLWPRFRRFWWSDWFDPRRSFLSLPSFWGPFLLILLAFALLCWKTSIEQELVLSWRWSTTEMYDWFKIPFWVLALLIPIIGLFNANHKSEQAKAAMELTKSQNNFANYYKHAEEFVKHCNLLEEHYEAHQLKIFSRKLHYSLYPDGPTKELKVSSVSVDNIGTRLKAANIIMKKMLEDEERRICEEGIASWGEMFRIIASDLSRIMDSKAIAPFAIISDEYLEPLGLSPDDVGNLNKIIFSVQMMQRIMEFDPKIENTLFSPLKEFYEITAVLQKLGIRVRYGK